MRVEAILGIIVAAGIIMVGFVITGGESSTSFAEGIIDSITHIFKKEIPVNNRNKKACICVRGKEPDSTQKFELTIKKGGMTVWHGLFYGLLY